MKNMKNNRIIKFEDFDFEATNNDVRFNSASEREVAEIDSMKSITDNEIKNAVAIATRSTNDNMTESVMDDMILLENIFTGLYNSIKNNGKKLGEIRNAVKNKMGEIKSFLANLGITRKMSADEIAVILSKLLGQKGLIEDFKENAEEAPKSLMTKILGALGATSGLAGVLTYVITTVIGIGKGSFQHGLGDMGGTITAISLVLALLSGIAYAVSGYKDEQRNSASLATARNNESVNENMSFNEDINTLINSLTDVMNSVMNSDDVDGDLSVTVCHNGSEVEIPLGPDVLDSALQFLNVALEEAGESTETSNLQDDYSDLENEPSETEPKWDKLESKRYAKLKKANESNKSINSKRYNRKIK